MVGIPQPEKRVDSYSFQLSGGMRQRVMIAMAISCNPSLLIADEPTTALDVSMQAQILKLLRELQKKTGMSMIFITHDLAVVAQMVDRVCVMYLGQIVEDAPAREIFEHPLHPYTRSLMASILDPGDERTDRRIDAIEGSVPEPIDLPDVCPFRDRCGARADDECREENPPMREVAPGHFVRCHLAKEGGTKR
jgi:oligopeptide/dipeptide ABC transporter ATP-binding protein